MPDELKRETAPACLKTTRAPARSTDPTSAPSLGAAASSVDRSAEELGWFEALGEGSPPSPPEPRRRRAAYAVYALSLALVVGGLRYTFAIGAGLALAGAAVVAQVVTRRRDAARRDRAARASRRRGLGLFVGGGAASSSAGPAVEGREDATREASAVAVPELSLDASAPSGRLLFKAPGGAREQTLLSTSEPFGVTLLSTSRRDRAVAMLTSKAGTFCVGARFDSEARRAFAGLLERAFTVARDEAGLDAVGPDGEPILLPPAAFASLLDALGRLDRGCFDRLVLSDARGAPLTLEANELRAGERVFDLSAPLEWRGLVFQESFGPAIAVYQGTWIRQGSSEVVLVSLLPSLVSAGPASLTEGSPLSSLDRAALRDLRLMQASPESPPPSDQRVAIERLFMLPLRGALDRAPRPSKQPPPRVRA